MQNSGERSIYGKVVDWRNGRNTNGRVDFLKQEKSLHTARLGRRDVFQVPNQALDLMTEGDGTLLVGGEPAHLALDLGPKVVFSHHNPNRIDKMISEMARNAVVKVKTIFQRK